MAISESRCHLDGETYIPKTVAERFNKKYGTNYEVCKYECDFPMTTLALAKEGKLQ